MNRYNASSALTISQTNNDNPKNPFNNLLIIDMSIWCPHDGTNRRATLVTKPADAPSCDALSSLCTAARCSVVFLGNGFIPLMRLDIYDHMLSIILIFAGHRRTSIAALARNPSLILTWRQLYLPMHQCVAHYETRGYDQCISVQLSLRNVN